MALLLRSNLRVTSLRLHLALINRRADFSLATAQVAHRYEVEVGRLGALTACTRLDGARIKLGRSLGREVVLHVDRALRTQRLFGHGFLLVGVANDVQLAVTQILRLEISLSRTSLQSLSTRHGFFGSSQTYLAEVLDHHALLNRRHTDRGRATGALSDRVPADALSRRRAGHRDGIARVRASCRRVALVPFGDNWPPVADQCMSLASPADRWLSS